MSSWVPGAEQASVAVKSCHQHLHRQGNVQFMNWCLQAAWSPRSSWKVPLDSSVSAIGCYRRCKRALQPLISDFMIYSNTIRRLWLAGGSSADPRASTSPHSVPLPRQQRAVMALDILRVVQIMWAVGDVLLTGGAFALLGIYGGDQGRNCRRGGLTLWVLCGIAPMVLYVTGMEMFRRRHARLHEAHTAALGRFRQSRSLYGVPDAVQ